MTAFTASWNYPTHVLAGPGRISELGDACRGDGDAVLVVLDLGRDSDAHDGA